jgi:hypothetical protein
MRLRLAFSLVLPLAIASLGRLALAGELSGVLHVPPRSSEAGVAVTLDAEVSRDWELDQLVVGLRPLGASRPFEHLPLRRADRDRFIAVLPADVVQPPGLEYFIASALPGGGTRYHFATAQSPHTLLVHGETPHTREAERLARHRGHRSELRLSGELTRYGRRLADVTTHEGAVHRGATDVWSDHYWVTSLDYRYRLLGVLYDIHFGLGLLRADWPSVTLPDGATVRPDVPEQRADPGLNFGRGGVTLEAHRYLSFELDLLLGASQDGFVAGVGGLMRIGRIASTRFELAGEVLQDVGGLGRFRFAWDTIERVPMALEVELSDRPGGPDSPLGSRLLFDVGFEATDQWTFTARAGYAARSNAREGGFVVGLATGFEF